jgi:mannose-1-phosphate guanylyltransferase
LAAIHVRHAASGDALLAVLPADHYIAQPEQYREIVGSALDEAGKPGRMVVLGIPPTHAETGFGYIERQGESITAQGAPIFAVRCFKENRTRPSQRIPSF